VTLAEPNGQPAAYDSCVHLRATLIGVIWLVWVLIWIGTAVVFRPDSRDPAPRRRRWGRQLRFRLLLAVFIILAVRTHHLGGTLSGPGLGWAGVVACVLGVGIATWARLCLGRSWGMPMTMRATPMLVRSGPYRVVRHPIYSGLLLAILGSALATGPGLLVAAVAAGAYFIASLRVEEADMAAAFPDTYPEYARHTKRLIPFVY
jgi:protein-S-isoprenylcysteine O-methyltransferase Ste14